MSKQMGGRTSKTASAPFEAWLMGLSAWFAPGLGHILQGRWGRGIILGLAVWIMFLLGMLWGGHLYPVSGREDGLSSLLQIPPTIADVGSGIAYIACWFTNVGFRDDLQSAARPTFEYGNVFLWVAGLLNYLAMLDAFDVRAGRKS